MAYEILVVDDDPDIVETIRIVLEKAGYAVTTAGNRSEAQIEIQKKKPDLLLVDVMMATDTDGFDLAYELKENPETSTIPIVMLTAMAQSATYVETFQFITERPWPVSVFLEKPVQPKKLLDTIGKILK